MKILVINGSPKGKNSITLQTVKYLELLHPEHSFEVLHVGSRIKMLEKDFAPVLEAVSEAELLLFAYPVYTFMAPYQLHRFIELLKESGVSLSGKRATQLSTSKHFYDITAHAYIAENCADLGLDYIPGLSADMEDLTTEIGRAQAGAFFERVIWCCDSNIFEAAPKKESSYTPKPVDTSLEYAEGKPGDIVVITNCESKDTQLQAMIERFSKAMPREVRIVNIREYPFKGGCLGCFNCAASGICVYKDGFDSFLRNTIQSAEAMVMAFRVKDHSMGASFKLYDDRQFCNGHRTVTMGKPVGYLVCGDYYSEDNLKTVIKARAEVGSNFLAGVATDGIDPNREIDALCESLSWAIVNNYVPPQNFYGIGGMKIFRDLIWQMQGLMRADHKFYKKHKQYDFPQKKRGKMMLMYLVGLMMNSPKLRAKMGSKINEGMLMPYTKVLKQTEEQLSKEREESK